jgi:hypothetical protein
MPKKDGSPTLAERDAAHRAANRAKWEAIPEFFDRLTAAEGAAWAVERRRGRRHDLDAFDLRVLRAVEVGATVPIADRLSRRGEDAAARLVCRMVAAGLAVWRGRPGGTFDLIESR